MSNNNKKLLNYILNDDFPHAKLTFNNIFKKRASEKLQSKKIKYMKNRFKQ